MPRITARPASMGMDQTGQQIPEVFIESDGVVLASGWVSTDNDSVVMHLDVSRGHLPPETRPTLIDAVFALLDAKAAPQRVHVAFPLGDVDLLDALSSRLSDVSTRAAGSTCLVDATTSL